MKKAYLLLKSLILALSCNAQSVDSSEIECSSTKFRDKIDRTLRGSVPFISVQNLNSNPTEYLILDTRELHEYEVSHIADAYYFGYDDPQWNILSSIPKDQKIVVYCSIGYRSEKIGEHLTKRGFEAVYNLYGSIFEWSNQGYPLQTPSGVTTYKVHTYNKKWSQWVEGEKIY